MAKNSVLVVGGTGTLGRQIVRQLLDSGYEVRCLIRPRPQPADFLRDWGAKTVSVSSANAFDILKIMLEGAKCRWVGICFVRKDELAVCSGLVVENK